MHVYNDSKAPTDSTHPNFDKLVKVRRLVEEVRERCVENWNLGQFITIDEHMIRYKDKYSPGIRQY